MREKMEVWIKVWWHDSATVPGSARHPHAQSQGMPVWAGWNPSVRICPFLNGNHELPGIISSYLPLGSCSQFQLPQQPLTLGSAQPKRPGMNPSSFEGIHLAHRKRTVFGRVTRSAGRPAAAVLFLATVGICSLLLPSRFTR